MCRCCYVIRSLCDSTGHLHAAGVLSAAVLQECVVRSCVGACRSYFRLSGGDDAFWCSTSLCRPIKDRSEFTTGINGQMKFNFLCQTWPNCHKPSYFFYSLIFHSLFFSDSIFFSPPPSILVRLFIYSTRQEVMFVCAYTLLSSAAKRVYVTAHRRSSRLLDWQEE